MKFVPFDRVPRLVDSPIQQWLCQDTVTELRGTDPRVLPSRPAPGGVALTWLDGLAGSGGSTSGIHAVPGNHVAIAINHWPLAIETHNHNFPDTDHDVANIARPDPRRYPRTDMAWFSPECTTWSLARGKKVDYDTEWEQPSLGDAVAEELDEDDAPAAKEARWRSRMLMSDVVRFSRVHGYRGVIVENVPDILKWWAFDKWLDEMHKLGYRHKVVSLNSAFAMALGDPAPQLRDRVYIVFWQGKYQTPNWRKWLSVPSWCPSCHEVVLAEYAPKPGKRRPMRWKAQYTYRCTKASCRGAEARPYVLPAGSAIDFTLPTQRIGDRTKPLAAATRARVAAGLARYAGRSIVAEVAGHTFERRPGVRTRPVDMPMTTQHTTASKALASPPMLVPTGGTRRGRGDDGAALVDRPMATRTTTENDAVVVPPFVVPLESGTRDGHHARDLNVPLRTQTGRHMDALVVPLRNNGVATQAGRHPLVTLAASGTHHALVMRNNDGGAEMSTPVDDPLRTLTTKGHQSLVGWDSTMLMRNQTARGDQGQMSTPAGEPFRTLLADGPRPSVVGWANLQYSYDSGALRPLLEPFATQTTVEGEAVVGARSFVEVDDCTLRMLAVHEIQAGMAFGGGFVLLGSAKRDKVRMLGNAVTPPAARDLAACLMEAITGDAIPTIDWGLV